jgi:hypothetical protein
VARVFDQFHFSLIERDQPDLLEPKLSREDWLRSKFNERFEFRHHGNEFHWVPQAYSTEFLVGVVERERTQPQRTPPEDGAREFNGTYWIGAMVVIDPINRTDGQRVAFEHRPDVGDPQAILASLVHHMNEKRAHHYALHFKPLFHSNSFWRFAEKHGGQFESVTFRFTVPNMIFGAGGGVKVGLERIGRDTNAQEVVVKLESSDGVKVDSESVKEAVEYGEEGNAKVTAKSLSGERWTSTKQKVTVKMRSLVDLATATTGDIEQWLRQALDREQKNGSSGSDPADRGADNS